MAPSNAARQLQCAHPVGRRWFYRGPFGRSSEGKPTVTVAERCQECGACTREDVPRDELDAKGVIIAALDRDPWEAK